MVILDREHNTLIGVCDTFYSDDDKKIDYTISSSMYETWSQGTIYCIEAIPPENYTPYQYVYINNSWEIWEYYKEDPNIYASDGTLIRGKP
jgi:hypothetical protein